MSERVKQSKRNHLHSKELYRKNCSYLRRNLWANKDGRVPHLGDGSLSETSDDPFIAMPCCSNIAYNSMNLRASAKRRYGDTLAKM